MSQRPADVVIIGAGLVGALAAIYLARRGLTVDIYERRGDMRRETIAAGRSINLAISTRGLHALAGVGLEADVLSRAIPMKGRMIHPVKGELSLQPYGKDDSQCINSISRGDLNRFLIDQAEATGKVRFHFHHRLVEGSLVRDVLWFQRESDGARVQVEANRVLGADGAYSAVRGVLAAQSELKSTEDELDYGYKELHIPPLGAGKFRMEANALHIWPRGAYMLIALPNFDGSFTCTLFLAFDGTPSFQTLAKPGDVQEFFQTQFPDAVPLMPQLLADFFQNPTGRMVTVKTAPWHYRDRVLLLGDAAHAIVPFFGQGMNCGFEDCFVLDQILAETTDWSKVNERFFEARKINADAIADLALENFTEMRDKVADARFLLQREVERALQRRFPDDYLTRYQLVTFSNIPYRKAYEIGLEQARVLEEVTLHATRFEDVDLAHAESLVQSRLLPKMKELL